MSYFLPHLPSGWHVDEAIKSEEDRVVVIRFGHDWDSQCMVMDETLYSVAEKVQNFAVIYLCDITEVPDFNKMYELYDPCTVMFFYRNKHIMIDLGTGNNNKINWAMDNKQELIDIIETVYRGASKGRGLVVSPKGTILLVCPAHFVKLIDIKRLLDTLQVLRMPIAIPSSFLLCR
ncbi:mitosis protein DIM1-domain-containing protein [Russula emetica]|nr:mitosis protein DIM1-domain-containing protein [Russula emetica]